MIIRCVSLGFKWTLIMCVYVFYWTILLLIPAFLQNNEIPNIEDQLAKRASDTSGTQPPFTHRFYTTKSVKTVKNTNSSTIINTLSTDYFFSVSLHVPLTCTAGLKYTLFRTI